MSAISALVSNMHIIDTPLDPLADEDKINAVYLEEECVAVVAAAAEVKVKPPIPIAPILNASLRQTLVRCTK
jgi:hypothetical protein